jgi:hypothetical protein
LLQTMSTNAQSPDNTRQPVLLVANEVRKALDFLGHKELSFSLTPVDGQINMYIVHVCNNYYGIYDVDNKKFMD